MKLKVLVITSIRSYHQVDLFDAIAARGEVDLCVFYLRAITPGRLWTRLPEPEHPYRMLPVYFNTSLLYLNPTILNDIHAEKPDLVVICQYAGVAYQAAMLYLSAIKIPWVFWSESPGVQFFEVANAVPRRLRPALRRLAFLPVARLAHEVWAIGQRASDTMAAMGANRVHDLPYYSDLTRFAGNRESMPRGRVRFLYAGRLSFRKGFDVLCKAFTALTRDARSDWELTICGDGDLRGLLTDELQRGPVHSVGFKELDEMPKLMREHDIFIAPSRYDGWGMVVPEALAAGLPVISTTRTESAVAFGAAAHPVVSMTPPGDDLALLAQLRWWLDHKQQLAAYSARAVDLSCAYDSTHGAERFSRLATQAVRARDER